MKCEIKDINQQLVDMNNEKKSCEQQEQDTYNQYMDKHNSFLRIGFFEEVYELESKNILDMANEEGDERETEWNELTTTLNGIKQEHASIYVEYMKLNDETVFLSSQNEI